MTASRRETKCSWGKTAANPRVQFSFQQKGNAPSMLEVLQNIICQNQRVVLIRSGRQVAALLLAKSTKRTQGVFQGKITQIWGESRFFFFPVGARKQKVLPYE